MQTDTDNIPGRGTFWTGNTPNYARKKSVPTLKMAGKILSKILGHEISQSTYGVFPSPLCEPKTMNLFFGTVLSPTSTALWCFSVCGDPYSCRDSRQLPEHEEIARSPFQRQQADRGGAGVAVLPVLQAGGPRECNAWYATIGPREGHLFFLGIRSKFYTGRWIP